MLGWNTYGTRASWMFPHTCFPVITITNWVVSSIRQPPGSHWMLKQREREERGKTQPRLNARSRLKRVVS